MVDTLGASVIPYLPKALEKLLAETEVRSIPNFFMFDNGLDSKWHTCFAPEFDCFLFDFMRLFLLSPCFLCKKRNLCNVLVNFVAAKANVWFSFVAQSTHLQVQCFGA